MDSKHTFLGIQYLRALAAALVVAFHVASANDFDFSIGASGVDIFFIISGFVMWVSTCGRHISPRQFLARRLMRLAPIYWLATLVTAAFALLKPQFFYGITITASTLLNSLYFVPYENAGGNMWPIVLQGWTLNIEIFFYALLALCLLLPLRLRLSALAVAVIAMVTLPLYVPLFSAPMRTWTDPILLELVAGFFLGRAYTGGWLNNSVMGFPLLLAGIAGFGMHAYLPGELRYISYGLPAFALVAGCIIIELNHGMPEIKTLHYLGDASYSLYLWHSLIIILTGAALMHFAMPPGGLRASIEALVTLGMSCAAYSHVEKRINDWLKTTPAATCALQPA